MGCLIQVIDYCIINILCMIKQPKQARALFLFCFLYFFYSYKNVSSWEASSLSDKREYSVPCISTSSTTCCASMLQRNVSHYPVNINLLKVNTRSNRKRCEIYSKLTLKTPERHCRRCSRVFIANFEHISHLFLGSLLFTLNRQMFAGYQKR